MVPKIILLIFSISLFNCSAKFMDPEMPEFIEWRNLKNPVYQHQDWSVKDASIIYKDQEFYLFFSAFFFDRSRERSHVVAVKTRGFKTFSEPLFIWDGRDDGWIGMCSPNITQVGDMYYLTYNSPGDKKIYPICFNR
jgi:predicted GH43/DUF377 family glycosyl hydrolase